MHAATPLYGRLHCVAMELILQLTPPRRVFLEFIMELSDVLPFGAAPTLTLHLHAPRPRPQLAKTIVLYLQQCKLGYRLPAGLVYQLGTSRGLLGIGGP